MCLQPVDATTTSRAEGVPNLICGWRARVQPEPLCSKCCSVSVIWAQASGALGLSFGGQGTPNRVHHLVQCAPVRSRRARHLRGVLRGDRGSGAGASCSFACPGAQTVGSAHPQPRTPHQQHARCLPFDSPPARHVPPFLVPGRRGRLNERHMVRWAALGRLHVHIIIIIWLLHILVETSFDLFRNLLLGDQLKPWELHPLVS